MKAFSVFFCMGYFSIGQLGLGLVWLGLGRMHLADDISSGAFIQISTYIYPFCLDQFYITRLRKCP